MRVIGGEYRGRRLASAIPAGIRPTTDRIRETLFNVLGGAVRGSLWLDAFSGSGAVAIEALSRGAQKVYLNDNNPQALRLIRKNLQLCGIEEGYEIYHRDVFVLLKTLSTPPLDFVFLDPPYQFGRYRKLLIQLDRCAGVQQQSTVILGVFKKVKIDFLPDAWSLQRTLLQGDHQLIFLKRTP